MKPTSLNTLAALLEITHSTSALITGVAIDSRKVQPGDLFFALPGNRVDGHDFIAQAAAQGAAAAVVLNSYTLPSPIPTLSVPDVLAALQNLARKTLAARSSKVIAITGSLGKTTTKEFVSKLLSTRYTVFSSPLSYNTQATVPLSILMADGSEDLLILEMGMTHQNQIQNLVSIAPPDYALLTTVAVQHAINFTDGLEGIAREKSQIFSHPQTTLGLFHHDAPFCEHILSAGTCPKKTFSLQDRCADYFLEPTAQGVCIYAKNENPIEICLKLPLKVHHHNFLAAVSLARTLEISWKAIQEAAYSLKLPPMRFETVEKNGICFINDAYNANPDAMKAALESLPKPKPGGKTIAVLGEMDALGTYSEEGHALVAKTALSHVDHILCLGGRWKSPAELWISEKKPHTLFESRNELALAIAELAKPGDVVLLKGARKHALDEILD